MNLEAINWNMIGSATAVISFFYLCWRSLKSDLKEKIENIECTLKEEIEGMQLDLKEEISHLRDESRLQFTTLKSEIRDFRTEMNSDYEFLDGQVAEIKDNHTEIVERLSFIEAATLYTMPLEPAQVNQRSHAAREMWKRRKQKKLEKKG